MHWRVEDAAGRSRKKNVSLLSKPPFEEGVTLTKRPIAYHKRIRSFIVWLDHTRTLSSAILLLPIPSSVQNLPFNNPKIATTKHGI